MIFDEPTLRKLHRLRLVAARVRAGVLQGERRSSRRGSGLEFADFRSYAPGDDLRRLDWNIYARLDRPFLRLFEEEQDLSVHLLVDASRSMDWGEGDEHKLTYALRLAAALGAIALSSGDALIASALHSGDGLQEGFGPSRSSGSLIALFQFLERVQAAGVTDLDRMLRRYRSLARRPGLLFLLSDLLAPDGFLRGASELSAGGYELVVVHLLHPDELDPPLAGDLRLVDVETGGVQEVSLDAGMRRLYRERLADWQAEIEAGCTRRGIRYLPLSTAQPWEKVILQSMRRLGVVR